MFSIVKKTNLKIIQACHGLQIKTVTGHAIVYRRLFLALLPNL